MKKTTTKLQFKKDTIRILQGSELTHIVGGAPTNNCTQVGTDCGSGSRETDCASGRNDAAGHGCHSGRGHGCHSRHHC